MSAIDNSLYWDPEGNVIFWCHCDVTPKNDDVDEARTFFDYKPKVYKPYYDDSGCPNFRAVKICNLGTWFFGDAKAVADGLVRFARTRSKRDEVFSRKRANARFLKFASDTPMFKDAKYMSYDELKESGGIPATAIVHAS